MDLSPLFSLWLYNLYAGGHESYTKEIFLWAIVISGGALLNVREVVDKPARLVELVILLLRVSSIMIVLSGSAGYTLLTAEKATEANSHGIAVTTLIIALVLSLITSITKVAREGTSAE